MVLPALALFAACCSLTVSVRDQADRAVVATVRAGSIEVKTGEQGIARIALPGPGRYMVEASAPGLETIRKEVEVAQGEVELELILPPASRQSITIEERVAGGESSATLAPVSADQVKRLPTDPPTLRDALPLVPGVLRTPEGRLTISASPEYRSSLLVNSLDVTDPATGSFGATVPIDAVAAMNVFKSPYLAEYGRFTAAVVVVDTKRGGDKWHGELNDPTPELRIRSRHIRGVRGFTPRPSVTGPLIKGKLYLAQSGEYRLNKTPVFTLPFPENETWRENWNSLTQLDWISSARHALTATVHIVPQKLKFAGINFYTPRRASANLRTREFHTGITDRLTIGGGVLESAISASETTGRTWAQGEDELTLTPVRNLGNYFFEQDRRGRRYQWLEAYSVSRGRHNWKIGSGLIRTTLRGWALARPVNIAGWDAIPLERDGRAGTAPLSETRRISTAGSGRLPGGRGRPSCPTFGAGCFTGERIEYTTAPGFALHDLESGSYVHDHWQLRPALAIDLGGRLDWQQATGTWRMAPRAGLSWAPFGDSATVLRWGFGWFYDRAPLAAQAWPSYPEQIVDGVTYGNRLGERDGAGALVWGASRSGNFAPRSRNWSAQAEHRFGSIVRVRAGYLESRSEGLIVLRPEAGGLTMSADGRSRYRQVEVVSRVSYREGQEIFVSYVHSLARGNLNDFADRLGPVPAAVVRPDYYAVGPADTPHRLLLWGVVPFNSKTRVAPVVEYRTGLPYSALDEWQQYALTPNSRRFPNFFSLDFRVARDIHIRKHAVQISFSMFNVTNHWNPDSVRLNTADPQFGEFLGQHRRRFRLDFDFLF